RNEDKGSYPWVTSDSALFANPYVVGRNSPNIERRSNINASLVVRYRGNTVNIDAISAVLDYRKSFPQPFDGDFTAVDLSKVRSDDRIQTYTQEIRVSSNTNADRRLNWTMGTFLWMAPNGSNINNVFRTPAAGGFTTERNSTFNNGGIAFFGQSTYRLTSRLSATAGLRYDRETRKLGQDRRTVQANGTITQTNPYTDFATTFGAVTPKVSLYYQASQNSFVYAQYARGFRAGGLNAFAPTFVDVPYGPEYSDNYEIGLKNTLLNNRLRLNLTGFYLQQRNQQINVIENGFFLIRNTGSMNNLGTEIELMALPVKGLQVEWNASTSQADYTQLTANVRGVNRDLSGNKPLFNPEFASFAAVQYRYPLQQGASLFVRGEQRYTGAYYLNFDNVIRQNAFTVYNAKAGVTVKNVELSVWGRNLTDVQYRTWATAVFLLSNPRFWGATLSGHF
ncbi:MAG: TonB-dependent receptor, partial [Bacteroidetes bacterium]|nr:TonB-dependent receptor [Fibrella sp.]